MQQRVRGMATGSGVACGRLWLLVIMALLGWCSGARLPEKAHYQCKCVPDQWQGILASLEREFDLAGGRSGAAENSLYVSYDYANQRFAMTDLKTGNRAIALYTKGFKYVIREDGCRGIRTDEGMRQMCLPEHADYLGEFTLGTDVPVDLWQFSGPYNVSMKTTVIQKNCVPITEEVYMAKGSFVSLQSSLYMDVSLGIKDDNVFEVPLDCVMNAMKARYNPAMGQQQKNKRAHVEGPWSLMGMLNDDAHE